MLHNSSVTARDAPIDATPIE